MSRPRRYTLTVGDKPTTFNLNFSHGKGHWWCNVSGKIPGAKDLLPSNPNLDLLKATIKAEVDAFNEAPESYHWVIMYKLKMPHGSFGRAWAANPDNLQREDVKRFKEGIGSYSKDIGFRLEWFVARELWRGGRDAGWLVSRTAMKTPDDSDKYSAEKWPELYPIIEFDDRQWCKMDGWPSPDSKERIPYSTAAFSMFSQLETATTNLLAKLLTLLQPDLLPQLAETAQANLLGETS